MILNEAQAREVFGKHTDTIRECIEHAWDRSLALSPDIHVDLSPRSKASIVHDFIVAEARKLFSDDPEIQMKVLRGLFILDFGKVQLRFKKLNKQLRPQSIPTNQTRAFMIQGDLPGIPLATKVIAGYKLDDFQKNIQCIAVICPYGQQCAWYFELEKPKGEVLSIQDYLEPDETTVQASAKRGVRDENIGGKKI